MKISRLLLVLWAVACPAAVVPAGERKPPATAEEKRQKLLEALK